MTKVGITSRPTNSDEANNAKVYIGNKLCGTMPSTVESSKRYVFECDFIGDYVKVVTGRNDIDQKLGFSLIELYQDYVEEIFLV